MNAHLERAHRAMEKGDHPAVFTSLSRHFARHQILGRTDPFPAGEREADGLLEILGRGLMTESPVSDPENPVGLRGDCVIATVLYVCGGHTAVIRDLAEALPEPPRALWLTLAHPEALGLREDAVNRTGLPDAVHFFPGFRPWKAAREMIRALEALRPARLFLLHHPEDCVVPAVAAAARAMGTSVFLLHHADRTPSAGLYLDGVRIVDFTLRTWAFTRSVLGLPSTWLPLTCPDPGMKRVSFLSSGMLTTALSGSAPKIMRLADPTYPDLVAAVLSITRGRHVHIGPLPRKTLRRIAAGLKRQGLPGERFVYIPLVQKLTDALLENEVDLVINTYPMGGARTAVEVMAAGIPMVWFSPAESKDPIFAQMRYPAAPIWRRFEDLNTLLGQVNGEWLREQGKAARTWYESRHHPRIWKTFFREPSGQSGPSPPDGAEKILTAGFSPKGGGTGPSREANPALAERAAICRPAGLQTFFNDLRWVIWPILARTLRGQSLRWKNIPLKK